VRRLESLLDIHSAQSIWGERYNGNESDIFDLLNRVMNMCT